MMSEPCSVRVSECTVGAVQTECVRVRLIDRHVLWHML